MAKQLETHRGESEILRRLKDDYEERGYEFVVYPTKSILPEWFHGRGIDAVALKPASNVAIEVVYSKDRSSKRLQEIAKQVEGRSDWSFKAFYVSDFPELVKRFDAPDVAEVRNAIDLARSYLGRHELKVAFVWAWITFEAAYRAATVVADDASEARIVVSPTKIISSLEEAGTISFTAARELRTIARKRSALFHGDLSVSVKESDVTRLLRTAQEILYSID